MISSADICVTLQSEPESGARTPRRAEKTVRRNNFSQEAFVVTGPQCPKELGPWRDTNYFFEDNEVKGWVLGHAQNDMEALRIMAMARVESDKARYRNDIST